jgi:hypothetical protein
MLAQDTHKPFSLALCYSFALVSKVNCVLFYVVANFALFGTLFDTLHIQICLLPLGSWEIVLPLLHLDLFSLKNAKQKIIRRKKISLEL